VIKLIKTTILPPKMYFVPQSLKPDYGPGSQSKQQCVTRMTGFWRFTNAAKPLPSQTIIALRQAYHAVVKTSNLTSQKQHKCTVKVKL